MPTTIPRSLSLGELTQDLHLELYLGLVFGLGLGLGFSWSLRVTSGQLPRGVLHQTLPQALHAGAWNRITGTYLIPTLTQTVVTRA